MVTPRELTKAMEKSYLQYRYYSKYIKQSTDYCHLFHIIREKLVNETDIHYSQSADV